MILGYNVQIVKVLGKIIPLVRNLPIIFLF